MRAIWEHPVSYTAFTRRLNKMSLYDAVHMKRAEYNVRDMRPKTPIQDSIRRTQTLKEENIPILDLDELAKLEVNKIRMPKPKPSLWKRFISLFK